MFGNLGVSEVLLILLVVLLLFGAKRIPEIARGLGKGIREFKDATNDIKRELTVTDVPPPRPPGQIGYPQQPYQQPYSQPPASQPQYPPTPQQAPPPAPPPAEPPMGAPPPPAPPTEGQPPV